MALDVAVIRHPTSIVAGTTIIKAGANAGSTFPTMSAINDGTSYTDLNQAIALYNRRTNQTWSSPDTYTYVVAGNPILASDYNGLRTKIDALRNSLNLSGYAWTNTIVTGGPIKKADIDDFFSALSFSTNYNSSSSMASSFHTGWACSYTLENPRGTFVSRNDDATGVFGTFAGDDSNRTGPTGGPYLDVYNRLRVGFGFTFPNWDIRVKGPASSGFINMPISTWINGLSSWTPQLYQSSGNYTSAPANWASHADTVIGTSTYNTNPVTFALLSSTIKGNYGLTRSYLLSSDGEFANSTPSASAGSANLNAMYPSGAATLTFDLGY